VAKARNLPAATVKHLVDTQIQQPGLGFLGSTHINVLALNESLATLK
jgi:K+-transporting ATPase c subunit